MDLTELMQNLQKGNQEQVRTLTRAALDEGMDPGEILNRGLIQGMDIVGKKFQAGEYFIPHMLLAARAMHAALDILKPVLLETGSRSASRVVLGTVSGDHHDIGKNLVGIMLESKGFEVIDIGIDAPPDRFVQAVGEGVKVVAMSALLSTTAPKMVDTLEALDKAGLSGGIKTMVGGGVITQEFADRIGAGGYAPDAAAAADLALRLAGSV
jgi:5-methyltetrahydrofolate--homocysteine methyltransferase